MFRDNKREIFGFRKYKAYGLASAVIAAFFLLGGVASADEVTSSSATDATTLVKNSPASASADNAVAENTVANTATETPAVASGDAVSSNERSANASDVASVTNSETAANESSSNKTITATLTVPADRTVKASSSIDDALLLDKSKEQVINLNVSGEGSLPAKSRIEIEVTTDIDRGQEKVLDNDLAASSSTKIVDDNNGKVYKSVIDISGFKAGLQKEMIVTPNSLLGEEVSISPMHRFTTYNLYVGDELISTQKVTETFVPAPPTLKLEAIENRLTIERKSDGQVLESFNKGKSNLTVNSRNLNSVYKFELQDKSARLVDPTGRIDYERFRDEATNSYLINYSVLRQNFDSNNHLSIAVDTRTMAEQAYTASNETRYVDTNLSVTMYYSDRAISDTTDLSSLKRVSTNNQVRTVIEEKISNKGVLRADLTLHYKEVNVLGTVNDNWITASVAPPSDGKFYDDTSLPELVLKLNLDDKKLKPKLVDMRFNDSVDNKVLTGTYEVEVLDADTGEKLGVVSYEHGHSKYKSIRTFSGVQSFRFKPLTQINVGRNLSSMIRSVNYSVYFASDINDALSWKSELDHSNIKEDRTRYELQLLNDDESVAAQTATTLTILNKPVVAKLYNDGQSVFVPSNDVYSRLKVPFELVNANYKLLGKLYDVSVDESALRAAFKSGSSISTDVADGNYIDSTGSLVKAINSEWDSSSAPVYSITYGGYLKPGNHVYQIPITLKPKYDVVKTADANNVLKDGEIKATYTLVTYSEYTSIAESLFKTTDSSGDNVYVKNKDLTAVTTVGNLTQSDKPHLEAMAYIPKSGLEGSTADTTLGGRVKSVDGWDVLYTTDQISGSYKADRNLNYSSEVDDYSKVTAVKFVSNRTVKKGDIASFDVKLDYSKDLDVQDSIRYRSVLLTDNDEVLSTPVVARETKPAPTTVKELFRPDLTDSLTKRLYETLVSEGALFGKTDSLGGKVLFDESSTTVSNFESSTIKSLEARNLKERGVYVDLSDQIGLFKHDHTDHRNSSDLDSQFVNYDANNDLTVTNTGEQGSNATIIHYYRAAKGNIVERFVDESGTEIKTQVNSGEKIARYEYASYSHPATIETDRATYEYAHTEDDQPYIVPEGTTTVTYVYRKTADKITYGSVIATYKDTDGNELAPQENVKTDAPDGEAYMTTAKTIPSSEVVEKTPEGLTKRTTTSYELTETPANADGNVVGNQTITVPYVYRKNVTVQTYGSVIATYKDEEGNELSSTEKVITNQPGGTYYAAADKPIQGSAHATVTPEGRRVTITTYKLIKTPDNETGDVVGGEIIEVPYVYRKNVEERLVPGNTPTVDIPELKVTQYQTEDGANIKDSEQGFVDAPNTIDKYQFTGTTNTNEAGDVQTHIYKLIETEVPGNAPKVDIPVLNATRYINEEGTRIKDAEEGFIPAPSMIGDNYQFTGRTETTEDGTIQTHIYKVVEHEVPSDAPKREPEEIQITLHVDEETGEELVEYDPGLASPKEIEHYTYTGKTTQEEGIRIHYYKEVITEIPSDAPSVEIPELKATQYQTEDGTDVKDPETGFVDAPNMIGNYQFTGVTNTNESGYVQTHIYKLIETEVPDDAPQVDIPELRLTRHVNEKGDELLPIEEGSNGPRKTIGDYEYTGHTDVEGGVTTHVYALIRYEIPSDAPQYDIPELKVTRHVDEKGNELIDTEKGIQPPRKTIGDHEYTGRTTEKDGITTHVYTPIKHEIPSDAPQYDIPELKVTRHVDEKDKELIDTEKGIQPPRKTIGDHEYTGRTTEKDGITTHVYESIKHEVPGDAPIVDVPELKVTRYVNEKGEEIKESEVGFVDAPKTIGDYEFTGKTELNDGKDVQTHIYKLVEKPVMPTPDPKNPEPKKPETPQPEAPKPIETPKSKDSVIVESADQPQFVKNELPKTGETNSNLALVGVSVLTGLGSIGFIKRKREE